jgi:NAD(P)-dependent dehydrogenase (short-subunit alcohol dehydrogenase family)
MMVENPIFWITGAGSGFGRALALEALARHGSVILSGRRAAPLQETAQLGGAPAGRFLVLPFDVSSSLETEEAAETAVKWQGRIDVLINNAGIFPEKKPVQDMAVADWDRTLAVNARGPFLLTRAVLPHMLRENSGRILNISAPLKHLPLAAAYCASKCALDSLTKALAFELRNTMITVYGIEPPMMDTPMHSGGKHPSAIAPAVIDLALSPEPPPTGRIIKIDGL